MDFQSTIEVISEIVDIISKITEIGSEIDVKLWVGILSLVGVFYTVYSTRKNVNKTNDLKQELETQSNDLKKELADQSNNLKKELADQTNEITKELGEKNLKALEQRRYIDAISTERVKWINTIRDRFSEFIKLSYLQMSDFSYWKHKLPKKIEENAEKELINRFYDITYVSVQISLLLNPKEIISDRIDNLQNDIKSKLNSTHDFGKFNFEELAALAEELMYLHQVVLKSEWKRVKEENKIGEEIDDDAMNNIYISVAKNLDEDLYNKYLNQLEEKALN